MKDSERMKIVLGQLGNLEAPPDDQVTAIALIARTALTPFADNDVIDSGFGGGEACLDFWMDGKAVRVVISRVPDLDRENSRGTD